ncbi:MAG: trmNF [Clostridia bacterium]|nr:trmNF [Clostridia bacterium]
MKETIRLDDLHLNNLKIYQNTEGFCFGTDAVLLSWFASKKKFNNAVDLCTGNGVVPLLLSVNSCFKTAIGVEIQEAQVSLANESVALNNLQDKIKIINGDVKDIKNLLPSCNVDLVTVNPPYSPSGSGFIAQGAKSLARAEIFCTLKDVISAAAYLLKSGGRFCIVHKPERMVDIFYTMRESGIEPKTLLLVIPRKGKEPVLILTEGKKDGKPGVVVEKPLFIYEEDQGNIYTKELKEIYKQQQNIEK